MKSIILFSVAALLEVGGGYLVWLWLREHRSFWSAVAGFFCLSLYGIVPVFQSSENPFGRIYAAYGAVFIVTSVAWGWVVDRELPDTRDWIGVAICLFGAAVMMYPRLAVVTSK